MDFPTTNWTLLANATLSGNSSSAENLARLCGDYRDPVIHFLLRKGVSKNDSEDLAHQLFLELIRSKAWRLADQTKGRFRSFLLSILTHVMSRELRKNNAGKRGNGKGTLSLDELDENGIDLAAPTASDVEAFDREWALRLVRGALSTVESCFTERGKDREWAVLVRFLPGAGGPPAYEEAAAALNMSSGALRIAVHRVRQDFRAELRRAVSLTVSAAHEVDDELSYLHRVLSSDAV